MIKLKLELIRIEDGQIISVSKEFSEETVHHFPDEKSKILLDALDELENEMNHLFFH